MQHTFTELERVPGSSTVQPHHVQAGKKRPGRSGSLRLFLYLLRASLLLALTGALFYSGVTIIRQHARALGFYTLNFDVPLPFLLIGLWSFIVLALASLSLVSLTQLGKQLRRHLRRPTPAQ